MTELLTENNSGGGKDIIVSEEVYNHFNWGAFLLTWIWGLGNKSYITLLALACWLLIFVPYISMISGMIGLALAIWFGIKGNEWAWRNKKFDGVEEFHKFQKKWVVAGIIVQAISFTFGFAVIGFIFVAALKGMGG